MPQITVLLPVFNSDKYVGKAIESILNQTFKDWELIIINDGSKDETSKVINCFRGKKIRIIEYKKNMGLVFALNEGSKISKGKYITRMDADDISFKNRLQVQVNFMEKHEEIGVCGSWAKTFGEKKGLWKTPIKDIDIKTMMIFNSPLIHPSVMIKKSMMKEYPNYKRAEDYGLWVELIDKTKFHNIPEYLIKYRLHELAKQQRQDKDKSILNIRKIVLEKTGIKLSRKELSIFNSFANWKNVKTEKQLDDVYKIIIKILKHSNKEYFSKKHSSTSWQVDGMH